MPRIDELRLIARVARMYYEWNMRQSEIAKQLDLSQATVSRLLSRSKEEGIIRISVNLPKGFIPNWKKPWSRNLVYAMQLWWTAWKIMKN